MPLDKLVDELAKGKAMEKILRKRVVNMDTREITINKGVFQ